MKVGLYGGSFDPPHAAHLSLARTALAHLRLDQLRWIPAGQPWQKATTLAPAEHRAAMVAALIEGEPRFVLDRSELDRTGPSYTIDTVRALQGRYPQDDHVLVIGQDQYARMASWRDWQELLLRVTLAVAARDGQAVEAPAVVRDLPHRCETLPMPPHAASSTAIRAHLAAGGTAAALGADVVPTAVAGYIDRHGLYRHPPMEPARN